MWNDFDPDTGIGTGTRAGSGMTRRAVLAAGAALALAPLARFAGAQPKPRVIDVVARKFEFVPAEITVRKGEPVVLRFTAPEVPMGCNLADFDRRCDIIPGKPATIEFTPDRAGRFTFVCDLFCGSGHEDMSGTVIVT